MTEPSGYTALDLIGFTDKGDYDATVNYVKNDVAHYDNTAWLCLIDDTVGVTPVEGNYWTVFIDGSDSYTKTETDTQIENAINELDVTDNATAGSYVTAVSETDGKVNVTREAADATPTANSSKMVTSGGVYSAIATVDTALTNLADAEKFLGAYNICPNNFKMGNYGTSGLNSNSYVATTDGFNLVAGTYTFHHGTLSSHDDSILKLYLVGMTDETHGSGSVVEIGAGNPITFTVSSDGLYALQLNVTNTSVNPAYSVSEIATLNSSSQLEFGTEQTDYVDYAMTNKQLTENKMSYTDNGVLGAKNLLLNTATTQVANGVTFTVNDDDGSVTADGKANAQAYLYIVNKSPIPVEVGTNVIFSGVTGGGTAGSTYWLGVEFYSSSNSYISGTSFADGEKEIVIPSNTAFYSVAIWIKSGYTASNLTFYPMLRLATDSDDTYQPYAMTNQQLTEKVNSLFKTESYSASGTIAANSQSTLAFTITIPDGYKALGVIDFNVDDRYFAVSGVRLVGNVIQIRGCNNYSSQIDTTATVTVLYALDD